MALVALIALAVGVAPPATARVAAAAPMPSIAPPDKRVYMVSDSVGLGARTAVPAAFPPDWQVTVDGTPALFVEQLESKHVRQRMATSPSVFGDVAIVAGGYNYPFWDPGRFDRSIDSIINAFHEAGVQRIYWVTLREVKPQYISESAWRVVQHYYWYFPTVNEHLRAALSRHPDLTLIDWAGVADQPGLTYDAIHLNPVGAALYSQLIASTVMETEHRPLAGTVTKVPLGGVVPAAVAVNLAAVDARGAGFLTAYACDPSAPFVASSTFQPPQITATAAIVPVAPDDSICVRNSEGVHVVVDVTGVFPAGAGLVPITPTRAADTRAGSTRQPAGVPLRVPIAGLPGVPADASAVAVTLTATDAAADGFAVVEPCDAPPSATSSVNFRAGATVPNLAIVRLGDDGAVCVTANVDTHVVLDVVAAFDATADIGLVDGVRLLDTRATAPGRMPAGGIVRVHVAGEHGVPADASGAILNLTGVDPGGAGYLTAYPCAGGAPPTSSLNLTAGEDRGNLVIVAPDAAGDVCVSSYGPTDVVVDLVGWTGDVFVGSTPTRALDTRLATTG